MEHLFPFIMIVESCAAALVYACKGDFNQFLYWVSSALIIYSVTWR